ncbi:hypothetical protein Pla123a_24500 [Posidoniimonas polymericola]|uniref:NIPSNAP domain-containing protein n=1 Tax=Posidoniimonas polymericola TaxID=2528002 RepID=A0A5C5YPY2_9BACT|nr:NIPSNAP family protein [Posidoniimonas polymericola]TWT77022.1 hypothetical protein Pla123a_24500 [Posidoniimonas polymericola]
MTLHRLAFAPLLLLLATCCFAEDATKQVIQLRTYTLVDAEAEQRLDDYLENALLPALKRQGIGPVGVLTPAEAEAGQPPRVMLITPADSWAALLDAERRLDADTEYRQAAKDYLATPADKPLVKRITSELLIAFDAWPQTSVPEQKQAGKDRLFELRTYESPTEEFGRLKVEMFNSGEIPIFLDSGISPVFMGQAVVGDKLPNLTYLTVYDDADARDLAWKTFVEHADWQVLKEVKKYLGTVSKIHKSDWKAKSYSEL